MKNRFNRNAMIFGLIFLGLVATSVNLTKAFHIDDVAHIQIARAIIADPLHPMSGKQHWADSAAFVHELNQPHLFFYLMAGVMVVFGESALALHVFMFLVSQCAVILCFRLARKLVPRRAMTATILVVLGPAFLPGQNVMVDVPMTVLWLLFFDSIIGVSRERLGRGYALAGAAALAACLVKYTSLVLLPILVFAIVYRKHMRYAWAVLIPLIGLVGWSLFNLWDYGGIHILGRPTGELTANRALVRAIEWVTAVGAVAPFSVMLLSRKSLKRYSLLVSVSVVAGLVLLFAARSSHPELSPMFSVLWGVFYANGIVVVGFAVAGAIRGLKEGEEQRSEVNLLLTMWLAGAFLFTTLFAPFMAVRHVLPVIPAIVLLLLYNLEHDITRRGVNWAILLTTALGFLLAVSDHRLAGVYRENAIPLKKLVPADARVWSVGHWGWQWYAEKAGMRSYDTRNTSLKTGDYLIAPISVDQQKVSDSDLNRLQKVDEVSVPCTASTVFRTMGAEPLGGYYSFSLASLAPPWFLSVKPLETFLVFRVEDVGSVGE